MKKRFIMFVANKFGNFVIEVFRFIEPRAIITELYRKIADKNLILQQKVIRVKKGKVKYYLSVIDTKHGKVVYHLGRYGDSPNPVLSNRSEYCNPA